MPPSQRPALRWFYMPIGYRWRTGRMRLDSICYFEQHVASVFEEMARLFVRVRVTRGELDGTRRWRLVVGRRLSRDRRRRG